MPLNPRSNPEKLWALSVWHQPAKVGHRTQSHSEATQCNSKISRLLEPRILEIQKPGNTSTQNPGILESLGA